MNTKIFSSMICAILMLAGCASSAKQNKKITVPIIFSEALSITNHETLTNERVDTDLGVNFGLLSDTGTINVFEICRYHNGAFYRQYYFSKERHIKNKQVKWCSAEVFRYGDPTGYRPHACNIALSNIKENKKMTGLIHEALVKSTAYVKKIHSSIDFNQYKKDKKFSGFFKNLMEKDFNKIPFIMKPEVAAVDRRAMIAGIIGGSIELQKNYTRCDRLTVYCIFDLTKQKTIMIQIVRTGYVLW